jgi:predicted MFS family arabinose efflux permease
MRPANAVSVRALSAALIFLGVSTTAVGSLGAPLLATIVRVDHVSLAQSQWALTISLLVGAVSAPVMGRLADGHRRRGVILWSGAIVFVGCVLAALPTGFTGLLIGRALQGISLGLVPLAIAVARDALPAEKSTGVIAMLGVTTAVGIGIGYPVAGVLVEYWGMGAAFWAGALITALAVGTAALVLPPSPGHRKRSSDIPGALLLGIGVAGILLCLSEGESWGWASGRLITIVLGSLVVLAVWVWWELRTADPLVDLRVARHPSVFAADLSVLLVGVGVYPSVSLVVRLVQTPPDAGYGFHVTVAVAGLMLVPFSLASFAASRVWTIAARRTSPELIVMLSVGVLVASMTMFYFARTHLWEVMVTMALAGFGVGCIFAANPLQIMRGTPPTETGSAMSFYQVLRTMGFSAGSALSATALVATIPAGGSVPTSSGYGDAALISIVFLLLALGVCAVFYRARRPEPVAQTV